MGYNYDTVTPLQASEFEEVGGLFKAQQIDELAVQMDIAPDDFAATIQQYNEGFQQGTDEFDKDLSMVMPIQTPPFYAIPLTVSSAKSFGGAKTTQIGQVYIDNTVSSGLYAVGEASGFLGDSAIGWGFSGSITACYYQGKIAAEHIANSR